MEFCLSATFFSFRGGIYQQIFRTAMGPPVSVIVMVMEDVEGRATSDVPLRFWKRYKKCSTSNLKSARIL